MTQRHPTQQITDQKKFAAQTSGKPVSHLNQINWFWQQIKTVVSSLWAVFNGFFLHFKILAPDFRFMTGNVFNWFSFRLLLKKDSDDEVTRARDNLWPHWNQ